MKIKALAFLLIAFALTSCGNAQEKQTIKEQTKIENTMKPIEITKADFLTKIADYETNPQEWKYLGDKPALIDFYATWCGPCKRLAPVLEELAEEYADSIYIYKVDTDKERELSSIFGIQSIPTLIFIPMNGQPQISQGALPKADLKNLIDSILLEKK